MASITVERVLEAARAELDAADAQAQADVRLKALPGPTVCPQCLP